jgi:hypothetical protein
MAAMAQNDGSDQSAMVATLYLLGVGLLVVAGGLAGWATSRRLSRALRIPCAVAGAIVAYMVHQAMDVVGELVYPGSGWFHEEASVWLTASLAFLAGVGLLCLARTPPGTPPPTT